MSKATAFFDRDGTLNYDRGYVYKISDFVWIPGAKEAIKYLNDNEYNVIVVTNQSGIARDYFAEKDVDTLHAFMNNELRQISAHIDDFYYSPYHPNVNNLKYKNLSHLRKPNIGMLELAEKKWNLDKTKSFMVGDKLSDIECAKKFGIKGLKFKGGNLFNFILKELDLN